MKTTMTNKTAALALGAITFISAQSTAQLRVVATTPDLASVAREIGGDRVNVVALAKPTEDPHFVDAKPSFIVTLNRADALIEGGAELELGWLPPLLENARNGRINAAIDTKLAAWQRELAPYRGAKIVTYHRDFIYLAQRFGLTIVDELEPKPGIAPSPSHLAQVIGEMKRANAKVILVQPFQNRKTAETVARQTGASVLDTPQQPGAVRNTTTYFDMVDNLVRSLATGLGAQK